MSQEQDKDIRELLLKIYRMEKALKKIVKWFGEFPDTGRYLEDGSPMSYSYCNGSNGERDYMRKIARDALKDNLPIGSEKKQDGC